MRLLILGLFGVKCLDFGINTAFETFNYLMRKSSEGYSIAIGYGLITSIKILLYYYFLI
jgi:hypothetical protein